MQKIARLAAIAAISFLCVACGDPQSRWRAGGLYSVWEGEGSFGVVKILAIDPEAVSIRWYKESFPDRLTTASSRELSLGSVEDENFGLGHLALDYRDFKLMFPVHIAQEPVSEEELDGYRIWSESGAGAFSFTELEEIVGDVDEFLEAIDSDERDDDHVGEANGGDSGNE